MTKYLNGFPSKSQALARSREVYLARCKQWLPDNVTTYWFGVIENDETLEAALVIPEGEENIKSYHGQQPLFTGPERAAMVSEAQLRAKHPGWLKEKDEQQAVTETSSGSARDNG